MCRETGGYWVPPRNLRREGALEFLADQMAGAIFGVAPASDLFDLAATLVVFIIQGDVFNDANKRTALQGAWEFLVANGEDTRLDASAEDLAVAVAEHRANAEDVADWLRRHSR